MLWYELLIHYLGTLIGLFVIVGMYNCLFDSKKLTIKDILIICGFSVLSTANTLTNYTFSKIPIFYLLYISCLWLIFKDNIKKILVAGTIIYLILLFVEIICSSLIYNFNIENGLQLNKAFLYKFVISLLIMLISYSIIYTKIIRNTVKKIVESLCVKEYTIIIFVLILSLLFLSSISFKSALNFTSVTYLVINIILFLIMVITTVVMIYNIILRKKAENKENALLKFIKKYEYLIDKDRINRHEMLNNLLVIKSFKNRNSKEFETLIDGFITAYKLTGSKVASNLYNLPSGLKGIIYYKIYDMEKENIKVETNISNKVINKLDKLEVKTYTKICKIMGILIDNAIEATSSVKTKKIIIKMYEKKEQLFIEISNTADVSSINIEKINEKSYSSKGSNRGYGLFLVKRMISTSKILELRQQISGDMFLTTLIIKTKN